MNSKQVLSILSASIQQHNLQTAIRNMFNDKEWASVISPIIMGLTLENLKKKD